MPLDIPLFQESLKSAFKKIESTQTKALSQELTKNYLAGRTAGEKHKSTLPLKSADQDELTEDEKEELAVLLALFLGNLKKFNTTAQTQIIYKVKEMSAAGNTEEEIQQYVKDVFEGNETITIDNVGKTRKELYVDEDLTISEVAKKVTKPFVTTVTTYASLIGDNASHRAYETGRKQSLIKQDYNQWVFTGPVDERARPWHVALLGQVYTWGTQQSSYAERCLQEPRCRHRANVFYNDPKKDVPAKYWQIQKDEAGLYWDDKEQRWRMKNYEVKKNKTPLTKVEKENTKTPKTKVEKTPKVKPVKKAPEVKVKKEKEVVKEVKKVEVKKTPEEVEKIIKDHETRIRNNDYETGLIFDKNGKTLVNRIGKETYVDFTDEELKLLKGNILTHNHPLTGGSFSGQDIATACKYSANELRVVDKYTTYSLKLKNGKDLSPELWDFMVEPIYKKHNDIVVNYLQEAVSKGQITLDEARSSVENRIIMRVVSEAKKSKIDFEYKAIKSEV